MSSDRLSLAPPPLRVDPFAEDDGDDRRVQWVRRLYHSQDNLLSQRDRQIEENIRMLAGQQWSVYSRLLGRFIDISYWLSDKDRRWRQRPVVNQLLEWFMLTHARMTENPPINTFQPATGDQMDAELAEVMDTIFKSLWQDTGMLEVIDRLTAWMIPGGQAHLKSRVDPTIGSVIEWRGPAVLSMEGPGGEMIERVIEDAPYNREGEPLIRWTDRGADEWEATGKGFLEHEGGIVVDVLSPLQVRGQWANGIPWSRKSWHAHRTFLTPEEVFDSYGMEIEPDVRGETAERVQELRRVMFGSGAFGASGDPDALLQTFDHEGADGYVDVLELWHRPSTSVEGMELREDAPGGRLCVVTRNHCLRDGPRPARFRYTSPIRTFTFVGLPGRPSGTSVQESLNPLQRLYNRQWAQILEHSNLSSNPIGVVDKSQGLKPGDITNEPGQYVYANRRMGSTGPVVEFVKPPDLGQVVYRALEASKAELRDKGNIEGSVGRAPTRDPSGELVKELRFNADRFIGPTQRRSTIELARLVEDWIVILPTIWTEEKVISWAGADNILRTVRVLPHVLKEGTVNVVPDIESMLPEGRGERQARARADWQAGAFGPPDSPEAIRHYLDIARFPHQARAVRPGGVHRIMAERENAQLAQGVPADQLPVFEWHDHAIHTAVLEEFMAGPDYVNLEPEIQQQFVIHRSLHREAQMHLEMEQMRREAQAALEQGATAAAAEAELEDQVSEFRPDTGPPAAPRSTSAPRGRPPGEQPVPTRTAG